MTSQVRVDDSPHRIGGLQFKFTRQFTNKVQLSHIALVENRRKFPLDEIAALAELPQRTVRYYIQTGLVDRPQGIVKGAS
jgi:hypothetical protein